LGAAPRVMLWVVRIRPAVCALPPTRGVCVATAEREFVREPVRERVRVSSRLRALPSAVAAVFEGVSVKA